MTSYVVTPTICGENVLPLISRFGLARPEIEYIVFTVAVGELTEVAAAKDGNVWT